MSLALAAAVLSVHAAAATNLLPSSKNDLPADVARVLDSPDKAILYSLEPWENAEPADSTLHGFKIIGQLALDPGLAKTVGARFKAASASGEDPMAACFDPRHALSVTSGGETYDLLLCYACGHLEIFSGERIIADLSARGTAKSLNAILSANHLPLSRSGSELEAGHAQLKVAESRWLAAMPAALQPLWSQMRADMLNPNLDQPRIALAKQFPDEQTRILALYAWFGSGAGPWSGFPSYETVAEELLLDFKTEALIEAAKATRTAQQLEGAARLFGGWTFQHRRPNDSARLPPDLKQRLLAHSIESADEDKRSRGNDAFD